MEETMMKLARRTALAGALAVAALAGRAAAQTTVTMWTFLDPNKTSPREVALKEMIAGFEHANPTIKIKVEPQDFAQMPPKFFLGHRVGGNPDLVWIDAKNLGGLGQSGAGADLGPLITSKWAADGVSDFFVKAGWDAGVVDGKLVALPLFHGASVIYYRKDLFKQAGIDPAGLTSWDALAAAAKKLTTVKDGRVDVWGLGMPLAPIKTESTPALIGMLDQPGAVFDGCKANFAGPTGAKALAYTAALVTEHKVTPQEALAMNVDDVTDQFIAGRYAMAITSNLRYSVIAKNATFGKDNLGIIAWPSWSGAKPGAMPVSGWWVAVWNKSPRQAEAAKFAEYLVSRDGVKLWATVGGQVPTRKSLLADPFFKQPDNMWVETMIAAWSASSWMEPTACNTRTLQAAINEATAQVLLNKLDPIAALKEAERKFAEAQ
jgi:multiple sugar transport system substrate-binding protein